MSYFDTIHYQHFDTSLFLMILIITILLLITGILLLREFKIKNIKTIGVIMSLIIIAISSCISYKYCYDKKDVKPNLYYESKVQRLVNNNELVGMFFYDVGYKYEDKELFRTAITLKSHSDTKDYIITYKTNNDDTEKKFLLGANKIKYDNYDYLVNPKNHGTELSIDLTFKRKDEENKAVINIYDINMKHLSTINIIVNEQEFSINK